MPEGGARTIFGPLYRLFWYFSASEMHSVCDLYSEGVLNVTEQSIQSKPAWQRPWCWSSLGFLTTSPQAVVDAPVRVGFKMQGTSVKESGVLTVTSGWDVCVIGRRLGSWIYARRDHVLK